ncbi:MAG: hypothetical protein QW561_04850, partial [Candidatus Aenigmatarchaeota archaeon]
YLKEKEDYEQPSGFASLKKAIEEYTHKMIIRRRIGRLLEERKDSDRNRWFEFVLTLITITFINYFVV